MHEFLRDLRFGIRLLAKSPVGIGANTLIFSVVDALLLQPLLVSHPENLVGLIALLATAPSAVRAARTNPGSALRIE